jgi:hypothetical protein
VPRTARIEPVIVTPAGRLMLNSSWRNCTDISRIEIEDVRAATKRHT